MSSLVNYELNDAVATITMDDGKVNALSPAMQAEINAALDQAAQGAAGGEVKAVVLAGSSKVFSGGFDLSVFSSGDVAATLGMLAGGFELSVRCLSFPVPVIMAATGPAIAMGSFLLLSGDHRVGSLTSRCQANEVRIGMTLPIAAIEIMRMRLTRAAFQRAISMAATFSGDAAIAGGWLDEIVEADAVLDRAQQVAAEAAATLHAGAHVASKLKARAEALTAIRAGIDGLATEFAG
ncbi:MULTISPECIES: crotonase/enoyl-CoA hydratase family protein [unclassified Mycolicibacterium]|uniref:crotonase/enoyl-CoA hydratase family protein n=1 Tax=unclassified Mycolicibacterium TaxID=2636767 RepID=UPI0012DE6F0B|nr:MULTISPECIES: crotonase/enoyl-CoA hydratase family protein [unclassified Mycolicibacterium]MUL81531.1 crotonase/enoyl-CoA hydratase family protein [Mycolicibacterium sp. CBMA 329]MUL87297.1 crotonase/enoyl-CoA hydratase family protein [Mycolicibacterium sp. CBMA 331]MUM02584.1 crotonase/enoyl-CoA hydratase family protein [Mycolicibacterium sp. CBMA 334]MUM25180.1 crotonase/enoyl-CoA hydratase family protein [Mycolicibacterium sp. CBMA 295]MUM37594.1 crotonase/enoyl-CoA hydratase family prot